MGFEVDRSVVELGVGLFDLLLSLYGFGLFCLFGRLLLLVLLFLLLLAGFILCLGSGLALIQANVDGFSDSLGLLLLWILALAPAHGHEHYNPDDRHRCDDDRQVD